MKRALTHPLILFALMIATTACFGSEEIARTQDEATVADAGTAPPPPPPPPPSDAGTPSDDVADYARRCYDRLGITWSIPTTLTCTTGAQLTTTEAGVVKDIEHPFGTPNPNADSSFPSDCDNPAWLSNKCYGNTYVQAFEPQPGTQDVQGVLLCRHSSRWSNATTDFDDVAMIIHNKDNGETCWFQTGLWLTRGGSVPAPHTDTAGYWFTPSDTARIDCVSCHDSGPWMTSRWIDRPDVVPPDKKGKYKNGGIHVEGWAEPKYVTIGAAGLARGVRSCTSCHKIGTRKTCSDWIGFTTGRKFPGDANAQAQAFDNAYWMPEGHGLTTVADWDAGYKAHVDKLLACCSAGGAGISGCRNYVPVARSGVSPYPIEQPLLAASTDSGDWYDTYYQPFTEPYPLAPGAMLTLHWAAADMHTYCVVEATSPPGVSVPGMEDATYWGIDESDQTVGPFQEPGEYRFEMTCDVEDGQQTAQLVFNVSGGVRPPFLELQAIVDGVASEAATNRYGPNFVEVVASPNDEVFLYWGSDEIAEGSCDLLDTSVAVGSYGALRSGDSGFTRVALDGGSASYSLTCSASNGDVEGPVTVSIVVNEPPGGL